MYPFSIGVLMDGFRTDTLTALDKAVAVGATGIQVCLLYTSDAADEL